MVAWVSPWVLFSVKVPTALSHVEQLQTSYQGVGVKGLVVWPSPPEEEHTGRKGLSASPSVTSPHWPPVLVDSIDPPNKHAVRDLCRPDRQTNFTVSKPPSSPLSGTAAVNVRQISRNINGQKTTADMMGCNLTCPLCDSWIGRSDGVIAVRAIRLLASEGWGVNTGVLSGTLIVGCLPEMCNRSVAVSCVTQWLVETRVSKKAAAGLMSPQASSQCCDYWRLPSLICVIPIFSDSWVRALRGTTLSGKLPKLFCWKALSHFPLSS